jgi:uncharacterized membrane protein
VASIKQTWRREQKPMRTVMLFIAYYLVVTPAGWVSRLVRDPLARRWEQRSDSYWVPVTGHE